jgi:hypothetical protein
MRPDPRPAKGVRPFHVVRYRVIDDAPQARAWMQFAGADETRALADQPQRRGRVAPPPGDSAWSKSHVTVADSVEAIPQRGVIRSTDHGGKLDEGEPRSG